MVIIREIMLKKLLPCYLLYLLGGVFLYLVDWKLCVAQFLIMVGFAYEWSVVRRMWLQDYEDE